MKHETAKVVPVEPTTNNKQGPIEKALWPLRNAHWKINLDPGGWADIDIYLSCPHPGTCERDYYFNCGCVITCSTSISIIGFDNMIKIAVEKYLADPRGRKELAEVNKTK